jgi:hypothetical protein
MVVTEAQIHGEVRLDQHVQEICVPPVIAPGPGATRKKRLDALATRCNARIQIIGTEVRSAPLRAPSSTGGGVTSEEAELERALKLSEETAKEAAEEKERYLRELEEAQLKLALLLSAGGGEEGSASSQIMPKAFEPPLAGPCASGAAIPPMTPLPAATPAEAARTVSVESAAEGFTIVTAPDEECDPEHAAEIHDGCDAEHAAEEQWVMA